VIGLIVLILLGAWLLSARAIASGIMKAFKIDQDRKFFYILIYVVILGLPFIDEIVGRIQFQYLCSTEAKVWVGPDIEKITAAHKQHGSTQRTGYAFPIKERSYAYLDANTGKPFYKYKAFYTPGGWVMRSGLNLGTSSSCRPTNRFSVYRELDLDAKLQRGELVGSVGTSD